MEELILKNLIQNNDYFVKVFQYVKESHFSSLENIEIFRRLKEYVSKYEIKPNIKELGLYIKNSSKIPENLKQEVIQKFKNVVLEPPIENFEFLVDETEKFIQKEELSSAIFKSADIIQNDEPFEEIIGMIENALSITFDNDTGLDFGTTKAVIDRYEYYTKMISGIPLGLLSVDRSLGSGLRKKTLSVAVAPSHGGKSAILMSTAANNYLKGKNVLFVTLEMPEMEISRRIDANLLDHSANDLGSINKKEFFSRLEEINNNTEGRIVIKDYPSGVFSVLTLKSLLGELYSKDGFKPDLICIDYIGLMNSFRVSRGQSGDYIFFKSIAEELHGFAKQFDYPVFTAAQLNRGAYNNLDSGLDSIADSLGVIQTADVVIALLSNEQLREMNQSLIKFLKNRNTGKLSTHLTEVDFSKVRFTDIDDPIDKEVNSINSSVLQKAAESKIDTGIINFS